MSGRFTAVFLPYNAFEGLRISHPTGELSPIASLHFFLTNHIWPFEIFLYLTNSRAFPYHSFFRMSDQSHSKDRRQIISCEENLLSDYCVWRHGRCFHPFHIPRCYRMFCLIQNCSTISQPSVLFEGPDRFIIHREYGKSGSQEENRSSRRSPVSTGIREEVFELYTLHKGLLSVFRSIILSEFD